MSAPLRNINTNATNLPIGVATKIVSGISNDDEPLSQQQQQAALVTTSGQNQLSQQGVATSTELTTRAPGSCPDYGMEILEHYLLRERSLVRDATYLANQPEVTERMRCILLDWMVDVHIKFKLHPETFFLAVDVIDRYLSGNQVSRARLQLIGVVATLLAAKHEEIWPPEVKDCIYIAANTYSRDDILEAEREVANFLDFRLAVPTCYPILSYLMDAMEAPAKLRYTAVMFLEVNVVDYNSIKYLPSTNAFSAIVLALLTAHLNETGKPGTSQVAWPTLLTALTRTEFSAIVPCAQEMLNHATTMLGTNSKYQASRRKFSSSKFQDVAGQLLPTEVPTF